MKWALFLSCVNCVGVGSIGSCLVLVKSWVNAEMKPAPWSLVHREEWRL